MASGTGSHPNKISPRKFSEKIALLNKKEREANKKFEEIIKEVQATKQQQKQNTHQACSQKSINSPEGLSVLQDQLEQIDRGESYQAVHADSLEEIEKVYENLMKSVGQYDDNDSQESNACRQPVVHNEVTPLKSMDYDTSLVSAKRTSNVLTDATVAAASLIPTSSTTEPFYKQTNNNDLMGADQTRICVGHQQQTLIKESIAIPCESSSPEKNDFSSTSKFDACGDSDACRSPQQSSPNKHIGYNNCNSIQSKPTGCRARVVSFGSASRHKYPCANRDLVNHQEGCVSSPQQLRLTQNRNYHIQYLKEPSGDRSRQKSSSDPQLHISPNQHMIINSVAQSSRSENRLSDQGQDKVAYNLNDAPQHTVDYYYANNNALDRSQSQQPSDMPFCQAYADSSLPADYDSTNSLIANSQILPKANGISAIAQTNNHIESLGFCPRESGPQEHLYGMCDTTSILGQLPGIKICTIDDDSMGRMSTNISSSRNSTPPSKDGSLPDISNLKFGTNSICASPERNTAAQKQQPCWPSDNMNTTISDTDTSPEMAITTNVDLSEFCQGVDVNWSSYDNPSLVNVGMDVQVDSSHHSIQERYIELNEQRTSSSIGGAQSQITECWPMHSVQQPFTNSLPPKVNNILSNSDCGFSTLPAHQQQGDLMICTSNEFYNNIIRSRSHNNISSTNNSKRAQHHPYEAPLKHIEQHHTSHYCLPTDHQQTSINVRRIAELKACGTSTSPLDSSSDLNSPQSEMNSPASSTTEQCESSVLFLRPSTTTAAAQPHQELKSPAESLSNGSSSTLVSDGLHFISQSVPSTDPNHHRGQQKQQPLEMTRFDQGLQNQSHNQATGRACHEAQSVQQIVGFGQQTCQPMPAACSHSLHSTTYTSPTIIPTDQQNYNVIISNHNNQPQN